MQNSTKPVKGMRDFAPTDSALRESVKQRIQQSYSRFGFNQIETPVMENIESLESGDGGENLKMLFKILKRGEKLKLDGSINNENELVDYGLRFDLTLPLARFYANSQGQLPNPFKSIQMGNVWRAERSQKGRFRQFIQCDIDIIGSSDIACEIELIHVTALTLSELGFKNFKVKVNDRRILEQLVLSAGFAQSDIPAVLVSLDKLDKIGIEGIAKDLSAQNFDASFIDTLLQRVQSISATGGDTAEQIAGLCETIGLEGNTVADELNAIISTTNAMSNGLYTVSYDLTLVRGMGYYTGALFEIAADGLGSSIAGGGRYDNMVGRFLKGKTVPACGFSIGFERILLLMDELQLLENSAPNKVALLYEQSDSADLKNVFTCAEGLRVEGQIVSAELRKKNLKAQLQSLKQIGFTHFTFYKAGSAEGLKTLD